MMQKKEEVLKILHGDERFKNVLSMAKDDAERRAIKAYTDDFVVSFYQNVLNQIESVTSKDPDALRRALYEISGVQPDEDTKIPRNNEGT